MGFFFQFGIFSYILSGAINRANKDAIKEHLKKVSSMI